MPVDPNPRPTWTPIDTGVDWLSWQAVQVLPTLVLELNRLNRWRRQLETLLDEKSLNSDQRRELSYILDMLYKRGIIRTGGEKDQKSEEIEDDPSTY